jgi:exonuclease SbcC
MRPIILSLQAFGPFAATERVNFETFGVAPLFLINGPTGAGKSSLLDAICYALYGQTTGSERTGEQMRCDYADQTLPTEVQYLFELRGERYRVERSPEQLIPKKRGDGTTKQSHKAALYHLQHDGEKLLASRPQVVNKTITELLGLEVTQFRQVMVLPQGKFRELLTATSKERELIFGQLFQTSIYSDIERALYDQAATIRSAKQAYDQQMAGILSNVNVDDESQLNLILSEANHRLVSLAEELAHSGKQLDTAKVEHSAAVTLHQRYLTYQQVIKEQSIHGQHAEAIDRLRAQRLRAAKANTIYPHYQSLQRAEHQCALLKQRVADSERAFQERQAEVRLVESQRDEIDRQYRKIATLNQIQYQLEQYRKQVAELQAQRLAVDMVEKKIATHHDLILNVERQLMQSQQAFNESEKHLEWQKNQLESLSHKQTEHQRLTQQLSLHDKKIELAKRLINATSITNRCMTQHQQQQNTTAKAKIAATKLELAWYLNQAADLAKQLNPGEPCPVCGSADHPNLAQFTGKAVSKADVDIAKQYLDDCYVKEQVALTERHTAELAQQKLQQQLDGANEQLLLDLDDEAQRVKVQQQVADLAEQLTTLRLIDIESLEQDVLKKRVKFEQFMQQKQQADELAVALGRELVEHQTTLRDRENTVPDEFKIPGALETRLTDNHAQITQIEQAKQRFDEEINRCQHLVAAAQAVLENDHMALSANQKQQDQARAAWLGALSSSDFTRQDHALAAYMDQASMDKLDGEISAYDGRTRELQGKISTLEQDLAHKKEPDVVGIATTLSLKEQEYNQIKERYSEARSFLDRLDSIKNQLQGLKKSNAELEKQYQILGTLSDVANGRTGAKVSLHRFVLGVLLDDVLIQATQRLQRMSRGRYQLLRKSERSKGNAGSGLDLLVEDSYSGKCRDVATLSGGESFMAALALALGLSDVVQSYSGGIQLDTLFIDEGFGSLDPDSLDLAIDMLVQLRAGGRTIGIISHVTELKEQIDMRLDISVARQGSTITAVSPLMSG